MAFLDEVMTERISREAREVHFGRVFLTVLGRILWAVGAGAYHAFRITWLCVIWCAVAVKLGWQDARAAHQKRPSKP